MTAQLERLLDDVVVGKQEMVGAIDAVCNVAERIIGKLKEGATVGGPRLLGATVGNGPETFPPTPAMKRFADSPARQKTSSLHPATRRRYRSAENFSANTGPRKPGMKRLGNR